MRRGECIFVNDDSVKLACLQSETLKNLSKIYIDVKNNKIEVPVTAVPGKYTLKIDDETQPESVYILFNPWNPDCAEYVAEEIEREGFVLADKGFVSQGRGVGYSQVGRNWMFSQYDGRILDHVFTIVAKYNNGYFQANPLHFGHPVYSAVTTTKYQNFQFKMQN